MFTRVIHHKVSLALLFLLLTLCIQPALAVEGMLEGVALSQNDLKKASQPIGTLNGVWKGEWGNFRVELNHSASPATLTLSLRQASGLKPVVVTAEFSRKGRLITVNDISCLRQINERQWILGRHDCPALSLGQVYELVRTPQAQWSLRTANTLIPLVKD